MKPTIFEHMTKADVTELWAQHNSNPIIINQINHVRFDSLELLAIGTQFIKLGGNAIANIEGIAFLRCPSL